VRFQAVSMNQTASAKYSATNTARPTTASQARRRYADVGCASVASSSLVPAVGIDPPEPILVWERLSADWRTKIQDHFRLARDKEGRLRGRQGESDKLITAVQTMPADGGRAPDRIGRRDKAIR